MYRLTGIFAAFVILLGAALAAAPRTRPSRLGRSLLKNALDDIDAAYSGEDSVKAP